MAYGLPYRLRRQETATRAYTDGGYGWYSSVGKSLSVLLFGTNFRWDNSFRATNKGKYCSSFRMALISPRGGVGHLATPFSYSRTTNYCRHRY